MDCRQYALCSFKDADAKPALSKLFFTEASDCQEGLKISTIETPEIKGQGLIFLALISQAPQTCAAKLRC